MGAYKVEDVLPWLARHDIDINDRATINKLVAKLSASMSTQDKGFAKAISKVASYNVSTLVPAGVTVVPQLRYLYHPVRFGIAGRAGLWVWESVKSMFGLKGPRKS